jgi:hypothetical protein
MRQHLLILILAGTTLALVAGLGTALAGPSAATAVCGGAAGVTGPAYSGTTAAGNTYNLTVGGAGVTCAFATKWMRKLVPHTIGKIGSTITGPRGWRCTGIPFVGLPLKAYQGLCRNGAKKIVWSPKAGGIGG